MKPREFWIDKQDWEAFDEDPYVECYHVIEKSAYEKLKAENERLRNNETGCQADYANLERELTRELEAAKVMREALCSIEGGDARDEKEAGEIARTAIAKADEIRGKK